MPGSVRFYYFPEARLDELARAARARFNSRAARKEIDQFLNTVDGAPATYEGSIHAMAFLLGYVYDEQLLDSHDDITENMGMAHDDSFSLYRPADRLAGHDFDLGYLVADFHGADEREPIDDPEIEADFEKAIAALRENVRAAPEQALLLVRTSIQ